jgi:general secretion pathway protein A
MYIDYFKLSEPPFSLTPDPRFLYMSERHREGLAHLVYGVQQPGGFVQLTGDIGSGKTTLCRCLVQQLPPGTDIALVLNPRLTVIELLATVCDELGVSYPAETASIKVLVDALNQRLLESHANGRRTVLLIDEAQNLNEDVLEQIRLLTNLETSKEKLLQIILIGQPELLSVLKRRNLRQLAQRITARYHLLALSRRETFAYVRHRLLVSGRREPLFTRWAIHRVYRLSRGVPRAINIICDRALLGAYALDKNRVNAGIVRRASRETKGVLPWRKRPHFARTAGILALAAVTVAAAIFFAPRYMPILRQKAQVMIERGSRNSPLKSETTPAAAAEKYSADGTAGQSAAASITRSGVSPENPAAAASIPQPVSLPVAAAATASPRKLADILTDTLSNSRGNYSYANLYVKMGIKLPVNPSDLGCDNVRAQGYDCLSQTGNWLRLRRYDLPAVLEIVLPSGVRRQVAAIGLESETATLAAGKWEQSFSLSEINQVWDGTFILFWKPPIASRRLSLGDRSNDVVWLRRTLDRLEGKETVSEDPELFDDALKQRVLAFQRSQSLIQDGYVGSETLVRLTMALEGSGAPSLSNRNRR